MSATRRLILLRHAKAERPTGGSDLDRPLAARGRAQARLVGAALAEPGLAPDRVLVSPSLRTRQTWDALAERLPGTAVESVPSLYDAPAGRILDAVRAAPDEATCLLVIGHNPGLRDLAHGLADGPGPDPDPDALGESFPTAAFAVFGVAAASWSGLDLGGGRLIRFVRPERDG